MRIRNPREFTIRELAEQVIGLTGSRSELMHNPLSSDDPRHRQPDIILATEALAWEPGTNREFGLDKTIAYFDGWRVKSQRPA